MVNAQATIAIIIISLGVGILSFYLMSGLSKKKMYMEELVSQLINFVIFMWIGKILLNFSVFIKEPLTILAYPSNSHAFYLAVLFSIVTIGIKSKREKVDVVPFLNAFIHVFLLSSFVYEFIQIVWNNNAYSIKYMGLLAVLIVAIIVIRDRISIYRVNIFMLIGWTLGALGLAFIMPLLMVFGYTISPWFLGLILVFCLTVIMLQRKKVS